MRVLRLAQDERIYDHCQIATTALPAKAGIQEVFSRCCLTAVGNLGSFIPRNARVVVQSITIEDKKEPSVLLRRD